MRALFLIGIVAALIAFGLSRSPAPADHAEPVQTNGDRWRAECRATSPRAKPADIDDCVTRRALQFAFEADRKAARAAGAR